MGKPWRKAGPQEAPGWPVLPRKRAGQVRFPTGTGESETNFPDDGPGVGLIAAAKAGRVLGGQTVGDDGAAKRIDAVAIAVQTGLTVRQVSRLDLGYAPPLSPLWDPVVMAARQLFKKL